MDILSLEKDFNFKHSHDIVLLCGDAQPTHTTLNQFQLVSMYGMYFFNFEMQRTP